MSRRVLWRNRSRRGTARWPARLAVLAGLGVMLLAVVAPSAGANYGRVDARIGCDRTVSWTASASTEGTADERTNARVLVEFRPTSGQDPVGNWSAAGPEGTFDPSNDFRFSGTFQLRDDADSVELRVTPMANWGADGDDDPAGGPRFGRAELPDECGDHPVVATVVEDCESGGARVTVQNVGDGPESVTVASDGVPLREVEIPADGSQDLVVPLLEGRSSEVRVTAGGFVVSDTTVGTACGVGGPAAVVVERCTGRQAVVFATLGDQPGGAAQVRVAGAIVHMADMEPGTVLQRTLELPEEGATPIEVAIEGTTLARGEVGACEGLVTGLVTCGAPGRPACESEPAGAATPPPPPPPPPPVILELDQPMLPRTGPWERAIALLLGGALLVAGGTAVASRDRRRPPPSPVASALAPYRQRWWDDV